MPRVQDRTERRHLAETVSVVRLLGARDLQTREQAHRLWPRLEDAVGLVPPAGVVVIDLGGARRVGIGFLSAMVQVLNAARARHPGRFTVVKVDGADADTVDGLGYVLNRGVRLLPVIEHGALRIVGRLTRAQADTFDAVVAAGQATSATVARRLRVPPNAASNRLKELYELGLIGRREEVAAARGGRRFVYVPIPPVWAPGPRREG